MKVINGKKVLITGAAQGIGKSIATAFIQEGASVILTDIHEPTLKETADEFKDKGFQVFSYVLDVTEHGSIKTIRNTINKTIGPIDILVNNAGVVFGGSFLDTSLKKHNTTYQVNTLGLVAVTHSFLPDLISHKEAHLINIASASGLTSLPYGATYCSSKWSVIGFSESIRLELENSGHRHVKVTTVCPGYIDTGMFAGVSVPFLMPMLDPEDVARKIVEAVKKNKIFVLEPFIVKVVPLLKAFLPIRMADWAAKKLGATTSMMHWKGKEKRHKEHAIDAEKL